MTDAIRKKHVEQKRLVDWWHSSVLMVEEVDALFRELDAERGKVEQLTEFIEFMDMPVEIMSVLQVKGGGEDD